MTIQNAVARLTLIVLAFAMSGCNPKQEMAPVAVCPIHGEPMTESAVPIVYGFRAMDLPERAKLFPNCSVLNSGLCLPVEGEDETTASVCVVCDRARGSFLKCLELSEFGLYAESP